jgi:5-methylcytosine-specific restriction endonuclease McrA
MAALELLGRPRRRVCEQVRREEPNCWRCGLPIDLSLPRSGRVQHPMSSSIDEVTPRSLHPLGPRYAALDRSNLHHAHRRCNSSRGNGTRVKRAVVIMRSQVW